MHVELLSIALGCGMLFYGGDWLVDGIAQLAAHLKVPPVMVAFVVMGFGTSVPELFVAVDAMLASEPDIAMGNVVGSNIANLLLVLALTALITPLVIDRDVLVIDGGAMLLVAFGLWAAAADGAISRFDAALLVLAMLAYVAVRWRSVASQDVSNDASTGSLRSAIAWSAAAFIALPLGAHLFIEGAIGIANRFDIDEALIGLTVVALGTSLPEAAACLAAAFRRRSDMILGGILGSNIFNGTIVLGSAAMVAPVVVAENFLVFWIPAMIGASLIVLAFLRTDFLLTRREASLMLVGYASIFIL